MKALGLVVLFLVVAGCGFAGPSAPPASAVPTVVGTAVEPEPVVPASGGPSHVLLLGDSLMQNNDEIAAMLPGDTVTNAAIGASGLLTPVAGPTGTENAVQYMQTEISMVHPDVVVIEYSGNCLGCAPPLVPTYDSPDFFAAWRVQAQAETSVAESLGVKVLWVDPPPRGQGDTAYATYGSIYDSMGTPTVSWVMPLTDQGNGTWCNWLSEPNGTWAIRQPDGLHFTPEGNRRTAVWTAAAIRGLS